MSALLSYEKFFEVPWDSHRRSMILQFKENE